MKDSKKIQYNLIIGVFSQAITMVLGILVPRLVLTSYGSEVNGLLSSVTNIYSYIAIVEAGVAAASCQALYKPLSTQDRASCNAILSATNKYYHRTGVIYCALIVLFSTLYPLFIRSQISYQTIVLVILFNGLGNVINYFFHGKYMILLKADGRYFVRTGVETVSSILVHVSKIILISLGFDVILVQFVAMIASFARMLYITYYIRKHYGWIDLKVQPDTASISQSKNVFFHEINYLITNNVDTVLLTLFSTLKNVSVYSLYNLLFGTVNRVLRTVRESLEFKIAHAFHSDKAAFRPMFRAFEVYSVTLSFCLFTILGYFILPFIKLYTDGVTDAQYTDPLLPYLFVLVNLLSAGRYPFEAMIHIAGHFKLTQKSAVIESVINILASVVLVQFLGIAGALLGTLISALYRAIYLLVYVNKNLINRSVKYSCKCWGINFLIYLLLTWLSSYIRIDLSSYLKIFAFCIPYALGVVAVYFMVVSLLEPEAFRYVAGIVRKMLKRKK